ncbi:hypothetical protein PTKIN_Ptkin09bG0219800 [Pterospermum kingtungense]
MQFACLVEEDSVEDSKLNEEHSAGEDSQVDVKKIRASSLEVVGVVRACKPRKKGTGDKAKKSVGSVMVKEIATMDQCVTVVVEDNLEFYFFSVVYGSNDGIDHRRFYVEFQVPGVSDHSPTIIRRADRIEHPLKPFKFFNLWASHSTFEDVVRSSWQVHVQGNPMQALHAKLKRLKPKLKELNMKFYSNIFDSERYSAET